MNVTVSPEPQSYLFGTLSNYSFFILEERLYIRVPDYQGEGQAVYFGSGEEPRPIVLDLLTPGCIPAEVDIVARPE